MSRGESKGERTRAVILGEALALTSTDGLAGLTIGSLAERTGMSKSGLFAHFGSKEQLQQAVLEEAVEMFTLRVIRPATAQPRGLPRIKALCENWVAWLRDSPLPGGCPMLSASLELDDKPGPLRDYIAASQEKLRAFVSECARRAVIEGHFREDLDPDQFAFEMLGVGFAHSLTRRLLGHPEADRWACTAVSGLIGRSLAPGRTVESISNACAHQTH
ncbi:MAG TPA: TetR/AcrR family transcriptional regulator [Azospirillaceae bacterium]|nr:TetR/AcrR family transcriptional regulator [Azospirillaceae bacterium]